MASVTDPLRVHLVELLRSGHAHGTFDDAVAELPPGLRGKTPRGSAYSAWQLVEHLRIAQEDILRFSRNVDGTYQSPAWPDGYWPATAAPDADAAWDTSIRRFREDLQAMAAMVADPAADLLAPFPWGKGQTLLREALLVADHNAYHIGQLVLTRRLLGAWPG